MRIVSVDARVVRWAIAGHGAARGRSERAAVVLEVRSDGGVVGLGEAAPLAGLSLDTLDDAMRAVAALAVRVPFELADRDAAFAIAATTGARSTGEARGAGPRGGVVAAARFAIETALLDALARHHRISLATLLREGRAHVGMALHGGRVPLAAVVDDPESARRALAAGIRCVKVKVGAAGELERVLAIAAAAPGATLRIDANRSWPRAEVAGRLAAIAHLPIDYVEEPCADAHLLAAEPLPCKLALDESLATMSRDALRAALRGPTLAALVLKPTLLGGLSACLELAEVARGSGVAAIASHGLEGPVGTAACAELGLALGGDHPAGLAAHAALAGWRIEVAQLAADHVRVAGSPGLGFRELDLRGVVAACSAQLDDAAGAGPDDAAGGAPR